MRNSASCGTLHNAELHMLFSARIGSLCGKESQYSTSMRNSALDFRFLRSIGTNFPLHAELCSIGISAELRKIKKSNREFLASNIFHFLNLFYYIFRMMRKCCPNTPQEISASKLAENEGFCGNLRYGNLANSISRNLFASSAINLANSNSFSFAIFAASTFTNSISRCCAILAFSFASSALTFANSISRCCANFASSPATFAFSVSTFAYSISRCCAIFASYDAIFAFSISLSAARSSLSRLFSCATKSCKSFPS